ncbi:hypothetical protein [Asaia bogorensis]|uniref:hypothetical protein n=1 Tax=Asaia bogorensis TaxID=91915 RepID=UPI0013CE3EEB|nr:hypothetical protein [Asaia bogorensis]
MLPESVPVRVILSESDAVTEIGMVNAEDPASAHEAKQITHWIEPGHKLFLARQSPDHVAMLSLRLTLSEPSYKRDPGGDMHEQDDQRGS